MPANPDEFSGLVGRADSPPDVDAVYEVLLFGASSTIKDQYTVGTVTRLGPTQHDIRVEQVILLAQGQLPELLPGWQPLES